VDESAPEESVVAAEESVAAAEAAVVAAEESVPAAEAAVVAAEESVPAAEAAVVAAEAAMAAEAAVAAEAAAGWDRARAERCAAVRTGNREACSRSRRGGGLRRGDGAEQHCSGQRAGTHRTGGYAPD
jgi:hypothetical protein